jgi:sugar lactone lactonase YvrE
MAFDADCRSFHRIDSFVYEIHVFDYDSETADIQNQKLFARFTETDGMPDGLTMDADCGLWTALRGGSVIARLRPNDEVERRIGLPNSQDIEPHVCWSGLSGSLCNDGRRQH